jgi:RNA polymerase sigma factor (sigma-70 family)
MNPKGEKVSIPELDKIVAKAQTGSEDALSDLYVWFVNNRLIFSCAYRILKDWEEDIYDVIQECAIEIRYKIKEYDPGHGSFINWCCSIVNHSAIDQFRKRSREEKGISNIIIYTLSSDNVSHEILESKELSEILDEAEMKAGLSQRQTLIWKLYRVGYDIPYIAQSVLDDSEASETVSRDIWRIKRKLSVYLWTQYPDIADSYKKVILLFSMDPRFQIDLDKGKVTDELKQEFENQEISPPSKVIIPNKKQGNMWLITDKDKPIYLVRNEEVKLNVYS